jgi:hypothetical protein
MQGGREGSPVALPVSVILACTTVREPEAPVAAYGRLAEKMFPLPMVKAAAAPIIDPLLL